MQFLVSVLNLWKCKSIWILFFATSKFLQFNDLSSKHVNMFSALCYFFKTVPQCNPQEYTVKRKYYLCDFEGFTMMRNEMRNFTICTWTQPLWQVLFWNLDLSILVAFGSQTLRRIATINPLEEITLPLFHKFGVFRYKTTKKKNLTEKRCLNSSSLRDGLWLFFMQIPHCLFFVLLGSFI